MNYKFPRAETLDAMLRGTCSENKSFPLLLGSVLSIFSLFAASFTSLSYFFPSVLGQGTLEEAKRFSFYAGLKAAALLFLSGLTLSWLISASRKIKTSFLFSEERKSEPLHFWTRGLCFLLLVGGICASSVFTAATTYDEGIYTMAARNVALYGRYAYGQAGYLEDFSPTITVGPTVILPLAFIYKYLGDGMLLSRMYIFLWLLAALVMLYVIYSKVCKGFQLFFALFLAVLFLHNYSILIPLSSVTGEMATLFFLLTALFFLPALGSTERVSFKLFLSNFSLGLAIVTKPAQMVSLNVLAISFLYALLSSQFRMRKPFLKYLAVSLFGLALPVLPWLLTSSLLMTISPTHDTLYRFSQFFLFGVRHWTQGIARYGLLNFLKLGLLVLAATLFMNLSFRKNRIASCPLIMYVYSLCFLLWFFTCTDGHLIRFTTFPIFLLIPLSANLLPAEWPVSKSKLPLAALLTLTLVLFQAEVKNILISVSLKRRQPIPWISDQLKSKLPEISGSSRLWVVDHELERYLSMLTQPPVFRLRASDSLPPPNEGDLLAFGIRKEAYERTLYLFVFTHVPQQRTSQFMIRGEAAQDVVLELKKSLESIGVDCILGEASERLDEKAYFILEPLGGSRPT